MIKKLRLKTTAGFGTMLFILVFSSASFADPVDLQNLTTKEQSLLNEHIFSGLPSTDNIYIRNAYVMSFNPMTRTPNWVAYHIKPEYRDTPKRKGRFSRFRDDPDIDGEASDDEYKGLFQSRGFARGHLAPYAIMGGDRDNDGKPAETDEDDALTVYQGNYMSNIAPQHHAAFNGRPGMWWTLERYIQDELVKKQGKEVWVIAGCIFGPGEHEKVGPNQNIWVPPMFYKIVITKTQDPDQPLVLAFLFPHHRSVHGSIEDFLVTVDVIEAMTGCDFFKDIEDQKEAEIEDQSTWETWKAHFSAQN